MSAAGACGVAEASTDSDSTAANMNRSERGIPAVANGGAIISHAVIRTVQSSSATRVAEPSCRFTDGYRADLSVSC
jgi:hypothetical protein